MTKKQNYSKSLWSTAGFTLIEVFVATVIIGILSVISVISYGSYKRLTIITQLKSDLNGTASAMQNARTFGVTGYPSDINNLTTFNPGQSVTLTGGSNDNGKTYCVDATSSQDSSLLYYISSGSSQGAQQGICTTSYPVPTNLVATVFNDFTINLSWNTVSGATSYTLQHDISSSFTNPVSVTQSGTTATASGLSPGTAYYFRVQSTKSGVAGNWSTTANATTTSDAPTAPTVPVVTVGTGGSGILATITPSSCTTGTAQYGIRSHTNDGTWGSYSAWSTDLTATQTASQGVKYGYQAQARCYLTALLIGPIATGTEGTYIKPINAPAAPSVTATSIWPVTIWMWPNVTCAASTTVHYRYDYTITPVGYDSGWIVNSNLGVMFTTSTSGQTYTVSVQAQCYNTYTTSSWSASGSDSYTRP